MGNCRRRAGWASSPCLLAGRFAPGGHSHDAATTRFPTGARRLRCEPGGGVGRGLNAKEAGRQARLRPPRATKARRLQPLAACNQDEAMEMKEYRCRNCGQVFQVAELPGEPLPDPAQCPTCLGEDVEAVQASLPGVSPPPEAPPDEPGSA